MVGAYKIILSVWISGKNLRTTNSHAKWKIIWKIKYPLGLLISHTGPTTRVQPGIRNLETYTAKFIFLDFWMVCAQHID